LFVARGLTLAGLKIGATCLTVFTGAGVALGAAFFEIDLAMTETLIQNYKNKLSNPTQIRQK
jgi:hypothetical protein